MFMSGSLCATSVSIFVTQRLSAFRSCVATAYRLCYASRFIAGRVFLLAARQNKQACSALAPQRRLPRSHQSLPADWSFLPDCFQSLLPLPLQTAPLPLRCSPRVGGRTRPCVGCSVLLLFEGLCMLAYTVLPRFNLSAALACRGLRPCLLYYLCQAVVTAIAVTPSCPIQQRPSLLTYA